MLWVVLILFTLYIFMFIVICLSSFVKSMPKTFAHFPIVLYVFLLPPYWSSFYTLDTNP